MFKLQVTVLFNPKGPGHAGVDTLFLQQEIEYTRTICVHPWDVMLVHCTITLSSETVSILPENCAMTHSIAAPSYVESF